jgi:hypothetical protein
MELYQVKIVMSRFYETMIPHHNKMAKIVLGKWQYFSRKILSDVAPKMLYYRNYSQKFLPDEHK